MATQVQKEIPLLDLKAQFSQVQDEIEQAVIEVLRSGHYILGPRVQSFEKKSAEFLNVKHSIGCANGSDALYIALLALDIKPGDEVITTPFTYIATAEAITQIGATPVFADIDLDTFNINAKEIEKKITNKTKAIILVHLYGQACQMDEIMAIAQKHNIKVVEDSAQAFGTKYKDAHAGTIANIGTYSFYPTKNLSCAGDGGLLVTNCDTLNERLRKIRAHGSSRRYYHDELGVNSRLDEIQAAILEIKLKHIQAWNDQRAVLAQRYNQALHGFENDDFKIHCPKLIAESNHIYHQYTIRVESKNTQENQRDKLKTKLKEHGISSETYYPLSLHMQNIYKNLGYQESDLPQTVKASQEALSLPVFPELSMEDQDFIIKTITM